MLREGIIRELRGKLGENIMIDTKGVDVSKRKNCQQSQKHKTYPIRQG